MIWNSTPCVTPWKISMPVRQPTVRTSGTTSHRKKSTTVRTSVWPYDKPRQTHINDITPRNFVEVCVDLKQQGLAGYDQLVFTS